MSGMKLNLNANAVRGPAAPETNGAAAEEEETKIVAPVVGSTDENLNPSKDEVKTVEKPVEEVEKAEKTPGIIKHDPRVSKSDVTRVEVEMPVRGARFRFVKTDRSLGEFDTLKDVQNWIQENHVDPTRIEVLTADEKWVNFDTVKV